MVELTDVRVSYGHLEALGGVSFTVREGAVGLLGPNGAGKSTLLRTLLGFLRPREGSVRMFGLDMPGSRLAVRQRLGYMPERDMVSPKVSAVSFLTYCGCLYGMMRVDAMERAHEVLNYVGMGENRYRKMETYSMGMRQRVKFAQALVHDPKLLLLDEPTNGLDPEGRLEMLDLIKELARKRKVTTILSSHLMPDVEYVCERIIVIDKGRVVRDGSMAELTALRDGVFEIRARDNNTGLMEALEAAGARCRRQFNGNILVVKPAGMDAKDFFAVARQQGTQLRHMKPVRQSLEEAFMAAIGEDAGQNAAVAAREVTHADL